MVDRNNSDRIEGILRAQQASILLQSSISQSNGYCASLIYAGKTELLRMIKNFCNEKSDHQSASMLASAATLDTNAISKRHERISGSGLTMVL